MEEKTQVELPEGFDWQSWVSRWEKMQGRYLVKRNERFDIIVQMIRDTQDNVTSIIDLGCGPGSVMLRLLQAFPEAHVTGIDMDPTILPLARKRLGDFRNRAHFVQADLRDCILMDIVPHPVDAVVSATAFHWLNEQQIKDLYEQISTVLRPGGIFLNADHAASTSSLIQKSWETNREEMRKKERDPDAEEWDTFMDSYLGELGPDARDVRERALGSIEGIEEGLPLVWHFDQLRACGFSFVDCFWRCDCDAIYGGVISGEGSASYGL
jgi:trans-aconitate methyltransferase